MQMRMRSVHAKAVLLTCLALGSGASDAAAADPYAVIYRFDGSGKESRYPLGGVAADTNGDLYGATHNGAAKDCGTVYRLTKPAPNGTVWTFKLLHKTGVDSNECHPSGTPVVHDDFIDGTTEGSGGTSSSYGSVYRLFKGGTYRVLHTFDGTHGEAPIGLVLAGDGKLFGSTREGGPFHCPGDSRGQGVLYQTGSAGGFRTLHNFGNGNGSFPGELVFGADGAIYGTTSGRCTPTQHHKGVVFRMTTDRAYSIIYNFDDVPGDGYPLGILAAAPNGTLFGTTDNDGTNHLGTVYSLKPGAAGQPWTFTVLHNFSESDGIFPHGLIRDNVGNLYGTMGERGTHKLGGTLYRLSAPTTGSTWTFTKLHDFLADPSDGASPRSGLTLKDGVLYGTTIYGGNGSGTVFRYTLH